MKKSLYLCGTVHLDLSGPRRLKKVLETIKPDNIFIESYPSQTSELLKFRKETSKLTKETVLQGLNGKLIVPTKGIRADSALSLLKAVGYEVWTSIGYSNKNGSKIIQLEDEVIASNLNNKFLENLFNDPEKLEGLMNLLKHTPDELKTIFDSFYEINYPFNEDPLEIVNRNRIFADKMDSLPGRSLSIIGVSHLYGDEPTLRTLLESQKPTSLKLIHADYI